MSYNDDKIPPRQGMYREGYFTTLEIDNKLYNVGKGVRLIKNNQTGHFHVIFQKIICPFHTVVCTPVDISFTPNGSYVSCDYLCTANGHRIEVSSEVVKEGFGDE